MSKPSKKTIFLSSAVMALMLTLTVPFTGCLVVAAGAGAAGAVAYVRGDLQTNLNASLPASVKATNKAIERLRFSKISQQDDALSGVIVCRNAQDDKITITLKKTTDSLTAISIRVGIFGDETLSLTILGEIQKAL